MSEQANVVLARLDRIPIWPWRYKLLVVLAAGYFFAFFDIVNIGAALPTIAEQFGVSAALASWTITAGLVAYIVGAYANGVLADLWGRRLSLALSVGLFTLGSIGAGLAPSLGWLIAFRFIAGLGLGSEIASVTTYLGEVSPAGIRGKYTSWANVCAYAGIVAMPFVARALVPEFDWGWRVLLLIGAAGGATIFFMRWALPESPRWLIAHGRTADADAVVREAEVLASKRLGGELPPPARGYEFAAHGGNPTFALLRAPYRNRVLLLIALWFFYYIGNYGWLVMLPTLLGGLGHNIAESLTYLIASSAGFIVGALASVWLNDRVERKKMLFLVCVAWVVTLLVIAFNPQPVVIMAVGFIASTTIGLMVPIMYTLTAEHFATVSRATGVALTNGVGHIGGAIAPMLVLLGANAMGFAGGLAVMAASGVVVLCLLPFALKLTRKPLDSTDQHQTKVINTGKGSAD